MSIFPSDAQSHISRHKSVMPLPTLPFRKRPQENNKLPLDRKNMTTVRRMPDADVRAIFECLHNNRPPPPHLKFQIVPAVPNGLVLSPPPFEFEGKCLCLRCSCLLDSLLACLVAHLIVLPLSSFRWLLRPLKAAQENGESWLVQGSASFNPSHHETATTRKLSLEFERTTIPETNSDSTEVLLSHRKGRVQRQKGRSFVDHGTTIDYAIFILWLVFITHSKLILRVCLVYFFT